jgi:hypothetical protein
MKTVRKIDVGTPRVVKPDRCPLCGAAGERGFTGYFCEGAIECPNSDASMRVRREVRDRSITPHASWPPIW